MQVKVNSSKVESSGGFKKEAYSAEMNAFAFDTLSSGMYSDKEKAIVRELACNAADSHVAAGNPETQFIVQLPNHLDPTFRIRDFGTGLSDEDMFGIYKSYFKSTKRNTNTQTGCFGLGSKTPFAYTQSWTVISYFDGRKTTYANVVDEDGTPDFVRIASEETDEANGLEIFFAVKPADFRKFQNAAEKALAPFAVRPIVKGGLGDFDWREPPEAYLEGKGWRIIRDRGSHESLAIMGNVEYPLDDQEQFSENARQVMKLCVHVEFPLGAFQMTPSRESISWTKYSIQSISERLDQIYDEIVEHVTSQITGAKNLWDARMKMWSLVSTTSLKDLKIVPEWNGQKVTPQIAVPKGTVIKKMTVTEKTGRRRNSTTKRRVSYQQIDKMVPEEGVALFYADFPGAEQRISTYIKNLRTNDDDADSLVYQDDDYVYLVSCQSDVLRKDFIEAMGFDESYLKPASQIPKLVYKRIGGGGGPGGRRSALSGVRAKCFQYKKNGNSSDQCWVPVDIDLDGGGIYVELRHWNPVNTGHFGDIKAHSLSFEIEAIRKLREMGEDEPTPVYGIRTADLKKFREHGEWYELGEWIREQIWETWEEDADLRRAHRFYKHDLDRYGSEIERPYATMYDFPTRAFDALVSLAKKLPKDSFITQYMEQLNRLPLKKAKLSHLASLKQWHVNYFTLTWDRPVDLKHDIFLPIVQRYPMLAFSLEHVEKKPHQEQIVKYVTFMDKMHKLKAEGYAIVKKKAE
jgi:hypothetical protein